MEGSEVLLDLKKKENCINCVKIESYKRREREMSRKIRRRRCTELKYESEVRIRREPEVEVAQSDGFGSFKT